MSLQLNHTVLDRFLRYVKIDTQSDPNSKTFPSTEKQKDLAKVLVQELLEMGLHDAHMDDYGYVYATLESNTTKENVPVICFCSHMDTSPDCSGKGVNPIVHKNYQGADLVLPDDSSQVLRFDEHPELKNQIGNDIITAGGTSLLGADNKAGVAEIMDAVHNLVNNKNIKHGIIKILFTPDEEVGHGVDHVDLKKLGASFAYTVDGETLGTMEDETFSANAAVVTIKGFNIHPGFAKGKMQNATKIASEIIAALPKDNFSPETTSDKESFLHPLSVNGNADETKINFIIRAFSENGLLEMQELLEKTVTKILSGYNRSKYAIEITEQYRNMKVVLDDYPQVVEYALEAMRRSGLNPLRRSIRGGTDGSRLSFMGLPCPNIFAGEHAFHSTLEWVSVQDMQKSVETIINLCMIWEEKA